MMRSIVISLFILITVNATYAQGIGVRGGFSTANWRGYIFADSDFELKNVNSFHLGLYGDIELTDNIRLEPGIFYSRKGAAGVVTDDVYELTVANQAAYIDGPLLLKFFLGRFNFHAGPQVSLLMTNTLKVTQTEIATGANVSTEEDTIDQFNDMDVSLALGLGYHFDSGLNFSITYDLGLSNVLVEEDALTTTIDGTDYPGSYYTWLEAQNRVVKVSVGILF